MATLPPASASPESKRYLWMAIGALALVPVGLFIPWPSGVGLFIFAVALVLALFSLKMRRKALAIIAIVFAAIPFLCIGGITVIETGWSLIQGTSGFFTPKPKVEWDTSPTAIVAQATHPIRHYQPSLSPLYTKNYIPEARLWGDGRIVWTRYNNDGARTVLEGKLTSEQMMALLTQFVDAGYFGWRNQYASLLPYDNPPSDYLTVNLLSHQKTVSVTMAQPPQAFTRLFSTLTGGAGAEERAFVPTQGTLMAVPAQGQAKYDWDAEGGASVDLSKAADSLTIEGKALQAAWKIVNENPYFPPAVSQKGVTYTLYLTIPGLMN